MIGERLRIARIECGYTQEALAAELGISAAAVSQYETEMRSPSLDIFIKMINILHVSSEYILGNQISVTSDNTDYIVKLSREDLEIINEIKKYKRLHRKLSLDTKGVVAAWNRRIGF